MRKQTADLIDLMKKEKIDMYIISDLDDHLSEYTSEHFHALSEFSGFTGGDGKLLCTVKGEAFLWTDGRYFTQARVELAGSGIELMRMGEPGVPGIFDFIRDNLKEDSVLGFDGRCFSYGDGKRLYDTAGGRVVLKDLADELWPSRPPRSCSSIWILDERYSGRSIEDKLSKLKSDIKAAGADMCLISSLDDIAWLLNLRAWDIKYNPVFYAYMLVGAEEAVLYTDPEHFISHENVNGGRNVEKYLAEAGIAVRAHDRIYEDIKKLSGTMLVDPARCNFELISLAEKSCSLKHGMCPVTADKCRKNVTEMENLHAAQHKDSLAVTRFMYWFKHKAGIAGCTEPDSDLSAADTSGLSEMSCVRKLHELRSKGKDFLGESFETISAYADNAAMAHYAPSDKADVSILPKGLYLVDSGGQYPEGTTDITRTWSCGSLTDREKECFTLTVMANLRLADQIFPSGTSGLTLDQPARDVFWRRGLNYNHGTGHGVGFCLNVHEGPPGIRYRASTLEGAYPVTEGMYISDEPGYYEEGQFGIRTENMLLAVPYMDSAYGRFLRFEIMTFCPIDKTCLKTDIMEKRDIELLNRYHESVFKELSGDLDETERKWLEAACAPIAV